MMPSDAPRDARLLLLDKHHVDRLLQHADIIATVETAFRLHSEGEGRVFPIVREPLITGGVFGIKSGDVQSQQLLGFKAAGFWPANRGVGGEPHQATIMLFDPHTGRPQCLIDGNTVTTVRTGAAGALGLRWLARPESQVLTIFGTGVQARIQLHYALQVLPGLKQIYYVSSAREASAGFEQAFSTVLSARDTLLTHAADANTAVAQSDVIITATPGRQILFDLSAVRAGTHINGVGTDTKGKREWPEGLLQKAVLVADDRIQARTIGEMQWASDLPCVELGDLITARALIARKATDITLFDMTGLALQDLTVGRLLYERAQQQQIGSDLPWPW